MSVYEKFPRQQLSFKSKNKSWRKKHLDWAENVTVTGSGHVRKSVAHKKINYDLLNGRIHMEDVLEVVNPDNIDASFVPKTVQHYPIMNSKLNVLRGEESARLFDWRVVVTNPSAVSEIENAKNSAMMQAFQEAVQNTATTEEEYMAQMKEIQEYYNYEWQDLREIRANYLLNHFSKELDLKTVFNSGFMDALAVGEEIYMCDIVGGEPVVERLNPMKVRVFKSGFSNRIEDADIIVLEDYWSPAKIIDTYYDVLSKGDMKYIENLCEDESSDTDEMGITDERKGFVNAHMIGEEFFDGMDNPFDLFEDYGDYSLPYDMEGNVRVIRMFWKSRRKIKKVKSYNPMTGEETFSLYPETYVCDKFKGEEEQILWINEAWEGTKIGKDVYVNMRPRVVQYNRMSNPSRCHFGIIGSIYNLADNRPYSLVDMMKPHNYMYDLCYEKLKRLISSNMGKLIKLDLALVPKGWEIDKWMYFAKVNGIVVVDSFKEGNIGAATGKLAGAMNNNSNGVIDAELGNSIQQYINLLEFTKMEMSDISGISKQREGQISNRETVGGVERATLQSSHITEWYYTIHENLKKRLMECLMETAKIAYLGRKKKFQHILSDNTMKIVTIDGDEFAEADYGLVVDNSENTQVLNQQITTLAQAALQNQTLSFSTIMKLYTSVSLADKQRMIERDEKQRLEMAQQQQQMEQQQVEAKIQADMQLHQNDLAAKDQMNIRDNDTRLAVAQINSVAEAQRFAMMNDDTWTESDRQNLLEKAREFDERIKLDREKFKFDKEKSDKEIELKRKSLTVKTNKQK